MSAGSTKTIGTQLQCPCCGNIAPIQRKRGKQREKGHTKHMYCWKCKEVTGHIELKDEAFVPEWWRQTEEN